MKSVTKLDIQKIQYINIFEKVVGLKAKNCFIYNSIIIFTVPKKIINRAIGQKALNITRLNSRLNRKVKIIATPTSQDDLGQFINKIIFPHKFKKLSLKNDQLIIFSPQKEKAALIGRDKARLHELSDVLEGYFGIKKVIIK